jgi:hypothetical protein
MGGVALPAERRTPPNHADCCDAPHPVHVALQVCGGDSACDAAVTMRVVLTGAIDGVYTPGDAGLSPDTVAGLRQCVFPTPFLPLHNTHHPISARGSQTRRHPGLLVCELRYRRIAGALGINPSYVTSFTMVESSCGGMPCNPVSVPRRDQVQSPLCLALMPDTSSVPRVPCAAPGQCHILHRRR